MHVISSDSLRMAKIRYLMYCNVKGSDFMLTRHFKSEVYGMKPSRAISNVVMESVFHDLLLPLHRQGLSCERHGPSECARGCPIVARMHATWATS
jgi:hypothetical protein